MDTLGNALQETSKTNENMYLSSDGRAQVYTVNIFIESPYIFAVVLPKRGTRSLLRSDERYSITSPQQSCFRHRAYERQNLPLLDRT